MIRKLLNAAGEHERLWIWLGIGLGFGNEDLARARPLQKDWIDDIRDLCSCAGVPVFFKQWGRLWNNPDPNDPTAKGNGGTAKGGKRIDRDVCQEFPNPDIVLKKRRRLRGD